jgi:hypothetical protein
MVGGLRTGVLPLWLQSRRAVRALGVGVLGARNLSFPAHSSPTQIASGPDGAVWVTELSQIARVRTGGAVTQFGLPSNGSSTHRLSGIASGPDGNLWFADTPPDGYQLGKFTPGGAVQEFSFNNVSQPEFSGLPGKRSPARWQCRATLRSSRLRADLVETCGSLRTAPPESAT